MINYKLKRKIMPNLKLHMRKSDYNMLDDMFSECYLTTVDGEDRVTLKPPYLSKSKIALQFSALTGSFLEITDWDYIKTIGTLL